MLIDLIPRNTRAFAVAERIATTYYLNEREMEIVGLFACGHRTQTAARVLYLSPGTVRNILSCIYAKTGTSTQNELAELITTTYRSEGLNSAGA